MDYKFYLDAVEIDEPIGWDNFELSMKRDDAYHGMQFEVSTSALRFFGIAATYLQQQKETNGISANVFFTAQLVCDGEQDTDYQTIVTGRLNFGKYKDICGNTCFVEVPFEEEGCKVIFRNRFDQKVDIERTLALDNVSALPEYTQLGQIIDMPAKALQSSVDGSVADAGYIFNTGITTGIGGVSFATIYYRPDYETQRYNNIATGQLIAVNGCVTSNPIMTDGCDGPLTPQLLFEDDINCFDGNFTYTSRMKGVVNVTGTNGLFRLSHIVFKWDGVGDIFADGDIIAQNDLFDFTADLPNDLPDAPYEFIFDDTITGSTVIPSGMGFYAVLATRSINYNHNIEITFDSDTLITIDAIKLCPPSEVQYYMVHETLSRLVEAITNRCMRVKSEYYGRIDSQPFAFDADGCGSLRMFISGLKLRNAPDAKFFASAKDLIGGLNSIDNIGFSIEPDTEFPGRYMLVVEPMEYFYQDFEILSLDNVALVSNEIQENLHYAKVHVGYKKWEVEQVNGLNEFNSNREYRTNVETINTTLDVQSNLIAGSYPIEITRQQTFAESGAADTTYDNETFIVCLIRNAYDFAVEQDAVTSSVNIFDHATILNYRLSPIRNLMRWFKSIINTYTNISNSQNKLYFNAGTGNYTASGLLDDATACRLENAAIAENADLSVLNFAIQANALPVVKNETTSFEYPLSIAQYNAIKAAPYGYISYTCGNSSTAVKAFIKELKFRPARGMANFILRKKWEQ